MSRSTDIAELLGLFFEHVRHSVHVERALVLSNAALPPLRYRLVQIVNHNDELSRSALTVDELRQGGLLAQLLRSGKFRKITNLAPDASDPAFDLLGGFRSLMAFPIFDKGSSVGMVVLLGSSPRGSSTADLCALATMCSLLGRAIEANKMADQLDRTCRALDSELKAAADVQHWLLPSLPELDEPGIAASYRSARYSGGDYYDVGRLPDGRLGILIADVSGKGAAAAVLMAVLRSIVHDEVDRAGFTGPGKFLDYVHDRLRALRLPERGLFVTAFAGVADNATLTYSCAGHNPPRLLRAQDRSVTSLDGARTLPLGLCDEPVAHTEQAVPLAPGDLVLLYTDGITDARSPAGEFFGLDQLDAILRGLPDPPAPEAAIRAIAHAVETFAGDGTPADDQTLLAIGGSASSLSSIPYRSRSTSPLARPPQSETIPRTGALP